MFLCKFRNKDESFHELQIRVNKSKTTSRNINGLLILIMICAKYINIKLLSRVIKLPVHSLLIHGHTLLKLAISR